MKVSGFSGSQPITVHFTNGSINTTINGTPLNLAVPNATVTFSPTATTATTTFDAATNAWITVEPMQFVGNAWLTDLADPVSTTNSGGAVKSIIWQGQFNSDTPDIGIYWQWAAAVYTSFSTDYNALGVKPVDNNKASVYQNSDHADTPEIFKPCIVSSARGGGGTDFTGSYNGTAGPKCS